METISEKKNALMARTEAWARVEHAGKPTPTRKDVLAEAARHFKAKEDCVIIDKIFSEAGKGASRVKVLVYGKPEAIPKAKSDAMKIRMGLMKNAEPSKPAAEAKKEAG